ncbi:hypothetical protein JRC04_05345 [Mycolicibacterium sp. S2-37]|nr:hypothetical protein [Mycolicibacterium sp. S2-37]MBO0676880.1 hypothetical protein [Mycolicibacterium sp. S2-37]
MSVIDDQFFGIVNAHTNREAKAKAARTQRTVALGLVALVAVVVIFRG